MQMDEGTGLSMINTQSQADTKKEFEELLLSCTDSMYNLAYRLTQNRDDAFDLVQDATLRAFRFFHQFKRGTNFKGWILTIVRNHFINQYRKKKREPGKVNYDDVESFVGAPQTNGMVEEIFGESLQTSIDQLPEEMRTAITLFYVDGFAYKEIAQIMGCPIGTVMSRLYMAKQILKRKLKVIMENEGQI